MVTKFQIVELLRSRDEAVARALVVLNDRQTNDEQASEHTRYRNGRGFRPAHARMGTSMAKFYLRNGYLSSKQIDYWRREMRDGKMRIEIYAGQLVEAAEAKAAARAATIAAHPKEDIGNLMEERMVLEELHDSSTGEARQRIAVRLQEIDAAAEREMRHIEAVGDRAQTRIDEHNKFLARCRMEG